MNDKKKKILMIEDDSFLRNLYRDKLEKEGFHFVEAINGEEGMSKIINETPDLIILDILLPRKGGFDILEEMNNNEMVMKIPVIILSNLKQEMDIEEARKLGAKDYFIKTETDFAEFLESVKANI